MMFWNRAEKFLLILVTFCFLFLIQQLRIFSVAHINPNLILVGLVLLMFFNPGLLLFLALIFSLVLVVFTTAPYLLWPFSALFAVIILFFLLKELFTGDNFIDFLIVLSASTIVFYITLGVFSQSFVAPLTLFGEVLYNLVLGLFVWFLLYKSESSYE